MKCTTCGWAMLPPTCQNPDCKRGNKNARPKFKPPLRTSRGHGPNPRVRGYQAAGDLTIKDPAEQGNDAGWDNWHTAQHRKMWAGLTPAERAKIEKEIAE